MYTKKMNSEQTLAYLKQEAKDVEKTKNHYKYKSEYYRMMYERSMAIETLEKAINLIKKGE